MIRYLARRAGHGVLMLFGVSILLFLLFQAAPGDFLSEVRLNSQISPATVTQLRAQYGLDRPLPVRYWQWAKSSVRGEFGYSFAYNTPASTLLWPRARNTLLLSVPALIISWLIAVPLGVLVAGWKGKWADRLFSAGTSTLLALPDVLIALLALLIALKTGMFPVGGMTSVSAQTQGFWDWLRDLLWHMVLPVSALVIGSLAMILRHVRASVGEVLESSYMRAAEGHGLPRYKLLFRYALPAAANPLISLFGLSVALLLSVSLLIEVVMSWPGIGPLLLEAILARDLFVVIGAVMLATVFLIGGNLLADLMLYVFDPRIRRQA
ncbi:MAG TPA: ABC transporter permease [Candidatus Angelobacter sp.]|jgi:peptide/nickel transport system permease protein|nr:ABC transporter permease [Candidatus Angelobacter sp.]